MVKKKSCSKSRSNKNTKSQNRKLKKAQHFGGKKTSEYFQNKQIERAWDEGKTLRQNYVSLGLISDVNQDLKARGPQHKQSLKIDAPTAMLTDRLTEIQQLPDQDPYMVKSMSVKEQRKLQQLVAKYGEDISAMAKDSRINVNQETVGQLRRRIKIYNMIQKL